MNENSEEWTECDWSGFVECEPRAACMAEGGSRRPDRLNRVLNHSLSESQVLLPLSCLSRSYRILTSIDGQRRHTWARTTIPKVPRPSITTGASHASSRSSIRHTASAACSLRRTHTVPAPAASTASGSTTARTTTKIETQPVGAVMLPDPQTQKPSSSATTRLLKPDIE